MVRACVAEPRPAVRGSARFTFRVWGARRIGGDIILEETVQQFEARIHDEDCPATARIMSPTIAATVPPIIAKVTLLKDVCPSVHEDGATVHFPPHTKLSDTGRDSEAGAQEPV